MALVLADRVRETTTTSGTGTITLGGAYAGFQAFSVIGNGNTTYYAIVDTTAGSWEVGIGTYTLSGNTLSRDTVLASSNAGSLVNFTANPKDVIITQPSERAVYVVGSDVVAENSAKVPNSLLANSSITLNGTTVSLGGTAAIQPRVVSIADGTSITMNADTTDMATQANTQSAGTLTINAPTGTPVAGQKLMLRLSSTNVQTFSWNSIFQGSTDSALPTASTGSGKYDYMGFIYNAVATKWQMVAKNFGF